MKIIPNSSVFGLIANFGGTAASVSANGNYAAMAKNALVLEKGFVYRLDGMINFSYNPSPPSYTSCMGQWFLANGANNGTPPAALNSQPTKIKQINGNSAGFFQLITPASQYVAPTVAVYVEVYEEIQVFLVPWATMGTPANARYFAELTATKVAQL